VSTDPGHDADPAARLDALAAASWNATLEANPTFATSIGDHRFDDRMPDPTPEGAAADRARYTRLLAEVESLGPDAALPVAARVTRSTLREVLAGEIAALDTGLRDWNVDSLEGVPAGLILIQDYQRVMTVADGRAMVARWHAMAAYVDAHAATLRRALADGRVASTPPIDRDIALLDGLLAEPVERWPLVATPLAGLHAANGVAPGAAAGERAAAGEAEREASGPAAWATADRERFATDVVAAVRDAVRPAFARLRATLADEIRPAARSADEPGMGHVRGGLDGYRRLIRVHTSLDLTPDELHRTGVAEIDRIDGELADLAGRVLGTRSLPEALAALRGDPSLGFDTRDDVYDSAVTALARAQAAIPAWFGRLPRASCEVVRMGSHEEEHGTVAYYRGPAPDGSRPGQFYINTAEPRTRRRYEAEALAYHEAVPGHHLQIAIGQELDGIPEFRRHLGPTAFFEGWGLYTERLADEMGLYSGDLDRIGVLSFDAWRAARLVVDTGMHALGWTRDRAIAFMTAHTALAPNNIANEIDRYIVLPGQALAYKTGQLEMLRLRADARARLGAAFDIRGFHDALLGEGAVPLTTLREMVDGWVEARAAGR
jgi:uncharacterized protein (DUF885 family)